MQSLTIAFRLAASRLRHDSGSRWLDGFSIVSYAVSTWLLMTIVAGTHMFWERWKTGGEGLFPQLYEAARQQGLSIHDPYLIDTCHVIVTFTIICSFFACALVILPIVSLASAAVRVGLASRQKRLAVARLVGMSKAQVRIVSIVESIAYAMAGMLGGTIVYAASVPLWTFASFHGRNLGTGEMVMPWWGFAACYAVIVVISVVGTFSAYAKVTISPLGVARRATPVSVHAMRVVLFVLVAVAFIGVGQWALSIPPRTVIAIVAVSGVIAVTFGMFLLAYYVVGPYVLQAIGRLFTRTSSPARLLAARRLVADPKAVWRPLSALGIVAVIAGLATPFFALGLEGGQRMDEVMAPNGSGSVPLILPGYSAVERSVNIVVAHDVLTGIAITLSIVFIVMAMSTLSHQASELFDNAAQIRSLATIGMRRKVLGAARIYQVVIPMGSTLLLAFVVTAIVSLPFFSILSFPRVSVEAIVAMAAIVTAASALCACIPLVLNPLERRVWNTHMRAND